jgi:hypothetical protein
MRLLLLAAASLTAMPAFAQTVPDDAPAPAAPLDASGGDSTAPAAQGQQGQRYVTPYIELGQIVTADLTNGDVLTYSELGAGIDAGIQTRSTEAQLSYRYERDISWAKHQGDSDYHEGLARAAVGVAPGLSVEGGAIATRTRADIRGAAPYDQYGGNDNLTQIYAVYAGPTLGTHIGVVGVSASYRYGYTKADAPGFVAVGPNQPRLDTFDSAQSNVLQGSLNLKAGDVLPVGVTLSGGWDREDAHQLDQRYDGKFGRLDLVAPVSRTLALEGGVGYENITISQRDATLNADGTPVVDNGGRFVTDESSPRRIAYRTDGIIWDAGVLWRPSPRTQLEARVGRRYGSTSYTGSFTWAPSPSLGAGVRVYDEVDTFSRQLRDGLNGIPTSFLTDHNIFGTGFAGCTFGTSGLAAGGCLNSVFQSLSASGYRARGVDAVIVASRGPWQSGFGVGYANRHFYSPDTNADFSISGFDDQSVYAQYFLSRALDSQSNIQGDLYADWYGSGVPGAAGVYTTGATGSYNRSFGRIDTTASLGIFAYDSKNISNDVSAQAQLSMRYSF